MTEPQTKPNTIDIGKDVLDYKEQVSFSGERTETVFEEIWGSLPFKRWRTVGRIWPIKLMDDLTTLTTGDDKLILPVPRALDGARIIYVEGYVSTVSSSGAITIAIRINSTDLFSTNLTIDASEKNSKDAATPAVISPVITILRWGDEIHFDCDGAGTGAKGLTVILNLI